MAAPALAAKFNKAVPPLALVGTAYVVGKRRPLSELPPEQQEQIRLAYKDTEWASEYSVELEGIYVSYSAARKAASKPGYFILSLPVNSSYPESNGRYGVQEHPLSSAASFYLETSPGLDIIDRHSVLELTQIFSRLMSLASVP